MDQLRAGAALSGLDLELAWNRLRWEAQLHLRRLGEPMDWCFHSLHLRRFETARPGSRGEDCSRYRGLRLRAYQCLRVEDYLDWNALLHRAQPGLHELFEPHDGCCDFTLSLTAGDELQWWRWPLAEGVYGELPGASDRRQHQWLQGQLAEHRWWLRVDISHFFDSLDRRRLWVQLRRCGVPSSQGPRLMELLQEVATSPRGITNFGRISGLLAKLYLQPILSKLRAQGYRFALRTVDEFELFFQERSHALEALECLRRELASLGLRINYSQSWLTSCARARSRQWTQRWRPEYALHRLGAMLCRRGLRFEALVGALEQPFLSGAFVFRRPSYFELLAYPAAQMALLRRLQDSRSSLGDRLFWLLYFWESGQSPLACLRRWLEQYQASDGLLGTWCRACLDGTRS